jgi:hypothetical protein
MENSFFLKCLLPVCVGVSDHTRKSLIYSVQTTVITDEALYCTQNVHQTIVCITLQLVNYPIAYLWSSTSYIYTTVNSRLIYSVIITVGTSKSFQLGDRDWLSFCALSSVE